MSPPALMPKAPPPLAPGKSIVVACPAPSPPSRCQRKPCTVARLSATRTGQGGAAQYELTTSPPALIPTCGGNDAVSIDPGTSIDVNVPSLIKKACHFPSVLL